MLCNDLMTFLQGPVTTEECLQAAMQASCLWNLMMRYVASDTSCYFSPFTVEWDLLQFMWLEFPSHFCACLAQWLL